MNRENISKAEALQNRNFLETRSQFPMAKLPSPKLQEKLVLRLIKSTPDFLKECEIRPVRSVRELKAAAHLVYLQYLNKKYTQNNKNQLRISIFQLLKHTTTFIAVYRKKYPLATFTLVKDSPLNLPMDKVFGEELDNLRRGGRRLFEVTMLATNDQLLSHPSMNFSQKDRMQLLLHLIKAGVNYMRSKTDVDMVVITVHPRHEMFYRALQFQRIIEGIKPCESVQGSAGLALSWDWTAMEKSPDGSFKDFFGFDQQRSVMAQWESALSVSLEEFGEMLVNAVTEQ